MCPVFLLSMCNVTVLSCYCRTNLPTGINKVTLNLEPFSLFTIHVLQVLPVISQLTQTETVIFTVFSPKL